MTILALILAAEAQMSVTCTVVHGAKIEKLVESVSIEARSPDVLPFIVITRSKTNEAVPEPRVIYEDGYVTIHF